MGERKRGRRPNVDTPEIARKDEIIRRSVGHLIWFGFPQRGEDGVYSVVARCAADVLDRRDSYGLPLSADRIEQIHEAWKARDWRRQWARKSFVKTSLQDRIPYTESGAARRSLQDLAMELLQNNGYRRKTVYDTYIDPWTGEQKVRYLEDMIGDADAELTPKAHAAYLVAPNIGKKRGN